MRRKAFLFTFLVLSLLLAACVRSGGTEGENSYTIYYPAAELRDGRFPTAALKFHVHLSTHRGLKSIY